MGTAAEECRDRLGAPAVAVSSSPSPPDQCPQPAEEDMARLARARLLTHLGHVQQKNDAAQTDHCVAFRGSQIPALMGLS